MSDDDITEAHYEQMWSETRQLADAWRERHDISSRGTVGIFLQYGTSLGHGTGLTLDEVLGLVRAQWALMDKKEARR